MGMLEGVMNKAFGAVAGAKAAPSEAAAAAKSDATSVAPASLRPNAPAGAAASRVIPSQSPTQGYSATEKSILSSEGLKTSGQWFRKEGAQNSAGITKEVVEQTLKASPFTIIIQKLDVVAKLVTGLDSKITKLSENFQRFMDKMNLDKQESDLEKGKGVPGAVVEKEKKEKPNPWLAALPFIIGAAVGWIKNHLDISKLAAQVFFPLRALFNTQIGVIQQQFSKITEGIKGKWESLKEKVGLGDKSKLIKEEELIDKNGKALKGAARDSRIAKLAKEGKMMAKEETAAMKVGAGAMKLAAGAGKVVAGAGKAVAGVVKIGAKAANFLRLIGPFRMALRGIPLLAALLSFIDPIMALCESGGEITPEVKKQFGKAVGGLLGGAGGTILGGMIGTFFLPGIGTLIGGAALSFMGAMAGEYLGYKIADYVFGDKTGDQIMTEIRADIWAAAKKAAASVVTGAGKVLAGYIGLGGKIAGFLGFKGAEKAAQSIAKKVETKTQAVATKIMTPAAVPKVSGMDDVKAMVKQHEGVRTEAYKDTKGLWTIGVGHLIGDGSDAALEKSGYKGKSLTPKEVDDLFEGDFAKHVKIAEKTPGWNLANNTGKAAMIDLAFNMGAWWNKFKNTAKSLASGDFSAAANGLTNSAWYTQVGKRAQTIVAMIQNGSDKSGTKTADATTQGAARVASISGEKSGGGTASAATPKAPAPKAPGAGGGQPAVASATQSNKYPAPAGAASGAAPQQQASASTRSIPSPTAPHAQEDHYAVHFNAGQSGGGNVPSFV
jgi:hypothetical protein